MSNKKIQIQETGHQSYRNRPNFDYPSSEGRQANKTQESSENHKKSNLLSVQFGAIEGGSNYLLDIY